MQQTIHGDCTELTAFVCEQLSVNLHMFTFSREAVCCIHHPHRKHEQDTFYLERLRKYPLSLLQFSCRSN